MNVQAQTSSSSAITRVVDPIDYEKVIEENMSLLESSPLKDMLLFPEDDISVTTVQRQFRTVDIPVPGPAKLVIFISLSYLGISCMYCPC